MATETFHPFGRLPPELRDQIWDLATLPLSPNHRPAAHFFTLANMREDRSMISLKDTISHDPWHRYCLVAPQCSGPGKMSWTESNPSAYLSEIGLWGACKESRRRVQNYRDPLSWSDWREVSTDYDGSDKLDRLPLLATFYSDGQNQNFTIYPRSDLLCIQPFNFDTINWADIHCNNSTVIGAFVGVHHMALEFDPTWGDPLRGPPPCLDKTGPLRCIATAVSFETHWVNNLWFIDYRIRRRPGSTLNEKRHVFYANSCRYVQVRETDTDWELATEPDIFEFLVDLNESLEEYFAVYYFAEEERPETNCPRWGQPVIGVLACEVSSNEESPWLAFKSSEGGICKM
ncbi:hypothetical protein GGS23DRAFT_575989 [Durotheca rogersii]|uniref:uncharacterized protein n=1 Tax=Durotheca rogersii TaxID=419775 RepID=UPI00222077FF|nr:uncharacterized protein GGS23DRAFT_575989 [Durotheca rogersii]KAI5861648.1 hypothetical protein GGS23DRAFT_575989 [Durotheca rogersii]